MDSSELNIPKEKICTFKHSWVAYVGQTVFFIIFSYICFEVIIHSTTHWWITTVFIFQMLNLALFIVGILYTRSVRLFWNDNGVWCYSGIFPWSKGTNGIAWKDMESAEYHTGFISWLTNSYKMSVNQRFTKEKNILLNNIRSGDKAVLMINKIMFEKIKKNEIPD